MCCSVAWSQLELCRSFVCPAIAAPATESTGQHGEDIFDGLQNAELKKGGEWRGSTKVDLEGKQMRNAYSEGYVTKSAMKVIIWEGKRGRQGRRKMSE